MRLLDTKTGRFKWFEDPRQVRYAILSHVWSKDGEQSFRDVQQRINAAATGTSILDDPSLSDKIKSFCKVAQEHGFDFGWVDSCCIDKTSSSELSEAITSMYDWYRHADMCFAYLHDVDSQEADTSKRNKQFCLSQWFQRGWTLQELLAPSILLFLSRSWHVIGSKQISATLIAKVTNIDRDVLTFKRSLDEVTVACRMSWAASRRTTREEDEAYCLMGIFGVSFPIIYGEGRHAFVRLQEEIIKTIPDQTIFAWGRILGPQHPFTFELPNDSAIESIPNPHPTIQHPSASNQYLLASSPADYLESSRIIPLSRDEFAQRVSMPLHFTYQVFTVTAHGIHVRLPLIAIAVKDRHETFPTHLALLACETQDNGHLLALLLRPQLGNAGSGFSVGAVVVNQSLTPAGFLDPADLKDWHYRAVFLSLQDIHQSLRRKFIRTANLYLPHRPLRGVSGTEGEHRIFRGLRDPQDNLEVHLSGWSRTLLSLDESRLIGDDDPIVLRGRRLNPHLAPWLVIAYKGLEGVHINIQIGRCECPLGRHSGTVLLGALVWSPHAWSSLEQRFEEEYHRLNHPVHLHSWAYRDGVASTDVELRPFSSPRERITVHLTLYHPSEQTAPNVYQLGVEVASTEAQAEPPDLQVQRRDRGKSATHDVAFPSFQEGGYYRADAASYMPSDRVSVRGRAQSQTFYAPSSDDSWILPSPPLTAANSKSSNHTTNGWSLFFPRPGYAPAQGHPKAASHWQGRSSSWDARLPLADGQAFALSTRRHSFEDEEGRAQDLHGRPDEYSIYARNAASSVGDGRVLFSQLPTRTSSPSPIATSADVGTYSLDLGDFPTRGHSHNLRGKTLDGEGESVPATARMLSPSGGFEKGDPVASNSGSKHRTEPHSHPALPGPFDDAQQGLNRAALDLRVVLEPDHNAPPRVGRPEDPSPRSSFVPRLRARSEPDSPRDPDMGGGGSSPKTLWTEGGDPPSRLALQPPELAVDEHPLVEDTLSSNHLPQSSDIRSVPAAGEVSSATGRNGSRTRNDNGVYAPLPTSQVPNTVGTDNKILVQSFASATIREKRTNGQPERRQSREYGTYKDSKRRIGSGFMRGIQFFRRLGSSS